MLSKLSSEISTELSPRPFSHPSGARVELDAADANFTVLVECWAHQGAVKIAQKYKLVNDAVKLHWVAWSLDPPPQRLILCVSDEAAVHHLLGRSWQAQTIKRLGVDIQVVELRHEPSALVVAAQRRQ